MTSCGGAQIPVVVLLRWDARRISSQRRLVIDSKSVATAVQEFGGRRMFKNVGIATAGAAIGVPVWGIALAIGGVFVAGTLLGFALAGPAGAVAGGTAALAS